MPIYRNILCECAYFSSCVRDGSGTAAAAASRVGPDLVAGAAGAEGGGVRGWFEVVSAMGHPPADSTHHRIKTDTDSDTHVRTDSWGEQGLQSASTVRSAGRKLTDGPGAALCYVVADMARRE